MPKYLLLSGSPRKGNTDFVLEKIFESIDSQDKEKTYLRDKDISHCRGCLSCDKTNKCVIRDDMDEILEKLKQANAIILGTPNYFDNVPGILKDFIDRTNPFYETDFLRDKKIYVIVIGGGKKANSERVVNGAIKYFIRAHKMNFVGSYVLQGLRIGEIQKSSTNNEELDRIIEQIKAI